MAAPAHRQGMCFAFVCGDPKAESISFNVLAPQINLERNAPATPSARAVHGSIGPPYLSAGHPSNNAWWSKAYANTPILDADLMRQGPYAYSDPNLAQDLIGFAQPAIRLDASLPPPPPVGYTNVTRPGTADMPSFPCYSAAYTAAPWSNDNEAASAQLEGHEMHSSSHSSTTDPRFY